MLKKISQVSAIFAGLLVPGAAFAAAGAFVTTDLNIRTGPGISYQRFGTIPQGTRVTVHGCLRGYNWCDVGWRGERGWVSGNYLASAGARFARRSIPSVALSIGLPVIGFEPYAYHRRHYVGRRWYHDRFLGRRNIRRDRQERRDARRHLRQERRDLEHARRNFRQERRDVRNARQHLRRERRD